MPRKKIEWPSDKTKFEVIGYLARPGHVKMIEAFMSNSLYEKFKEEYRGKYLEGFPYPFKNKQGYQFRITLKDLDGCPDFFAKMEDKKFSARINSTDLVDDLVKNFGFKFTNKPQDTDEIIRLVKEHVKNNPELMDSFNNGFNVNEKFLDDLAKSLELESLPQTNIVQPPEEKKKRGRQSRANSEGKGSFSKEQLFILGWLGENYIFSLLTKKDEALLQAMGLSDLEDYNIEWYNNGFQEDIKWDDKSVGKGCDIVISKGRVKYCLEIKSSKKGYNMFSMTAKEIETMFEKKEKYVIIKVNNLEKLLKGDSPDIMVICSPYKKLLSPERIQEAKFKI